MGTCSSSSSAKPINPYLYIITSVFNPANFSVRKDLHKEFIERLSQYPEIKTITIECAFADQNFSLTIPNNEPANIQIRTEHPIWVKENLINIAIKKLKHDRNFNKYCKYIAWADNDIEFSESDFIEKIEEAFQKYNVVQLFKHTEFLDAEENIIDVHTSFGYYYALKKCENLEKCEYPHPGYAWCAKKDLILKQEGLFDKGILGSGDKGMAYAFIGRAEEGLNTKYPLTDGYHNSLIDWGEKAVSIFKKNLGYVDTTIRHYWHGGKNDRQYMHRWFLLSDHKYDPYKDLIIAENGVQQLRSDKSDKRDLIEAINKYFHNRNEDNKASEESIEEIPNERR